MQSLIADQNHLVLVSGTCTSKIGILAMPYSKVMGNILEAKTTSDLKASTFHRHFIASDELDIQRPSMFEFLFWIWASWNQDYENRPLLDSYWRMQIFSSQSLTLSLSSLHTHTCTHAHTHTHSRSFSLTFAQPSNTRTYSQRETKRARVAVRKSVCVCVFVWERERERERDDTWQTE